MALKFRKHTPGRKEYKPSTLQRAQWDLFAAIGYSIAIRGYLLCWRDLLKRAGFNVVDLWRINAMIETSRAMEDQARMRIKHLKELAE